MESAPQNKEPVGSQAPQSSGDAHSMESKPSTKALQSKGNLEKQGTPGGGVTHSRWSTFLTQVGWVLLIIVGILFYIMFFYMMYRGIVWAWSHIGAPLAKTAQFYDLIEKGLVGLFGAVGTAVGAVVALQIRQSFNVGKVSRMLLVSRSLTKGAEEALSQGASDLTMEQRLSLSAAADLFGKQERETIIRFLESDDAANVLLYAKLLRRLGFSPTDEHRRTTGLALNQVGKEVAPSLAETFETLKKIDVPTLSKKLKRSIFEAIANRPDR
jgi:hypothetical protein